MADLANLVLAIDSTSAAKATADLNTLTVAGGRAEAAATSLGSGFKGASAQAAEMATAAQLSARSAMDQAVGFGTAERAVRVNTMAMRESLVVARELSRGNFTRIPGSLTLLAQGIGSGGGLGAFTQALGLIKKVQDAELAEAAAGARASAMAIQGAAQRAAGNVLATDTELALAAAAQRTATTAAEETIAQTRLGAAHAGVALAAREATIAESALATANLAAAETAAAAAATEATVFGPVAIAIAAVAAVAGVAYFAFKDLTGAGSASAQVMADLKSATKSQTGAAEDLTKATDSLYQSTLRESQSANAAANESIELANTYRTRAIEARKTAVAELELAQARALGANATSTAIGGPSYMTSYSTGAAAAAEAQARTARQQIDALNADIAKHSAVINLQRGAQARATVEEQMDPVTAATGRFSRAQDALNERLAKGKISLRDYASEFKQLRTKEDAEVDAAKASQHSPRSPRARHPRTPSDHGLGQSLALDNAAVASEYALIGAYQAGDVEVMKALAHQKALENAIRHRGDVAKYVELELQKLVAQDVAKQAKTNADLQVELSIRARLNGQIADGTLTIGQYNEQLKLQTTLHGLNVDLELANAAHKKTVNDEIARTIALETQRLDLETQLSVIKQTQSNHDVIERIKLENSLWNKGNDARAIALAQYDAMIKLRDLPDPGSLTQGARKNFVQSEINKATANDNNPFHQWAKGIPKDAADINTALQSIEFKGIDSLASALTGVITGTESLGKAFKNISRSIIADIVQMTIKMLIFRAISSIIGGGVGGGVGAPSTGPLSFGTGSGGFLSVLGARAGGGPVIGGGTYLVGEKGPELFTAGASGAITPNNQLTAYPNRAANDTQRGPIELKISFGSAPDFAPYVEQVAGAAAGQAVKISVDHTNQTIKALRRPGISGGR